ncbi:DivIVA domain-containing protein [Krasilnikovia sp. MM14-A1004]|uniref:DivIVA domain-containing protein n=1 Tax=Krasilnikovia sp. MM14-A1004 TaxID=3373541 RepID=UPI00399C9A4C
MGQLLLFIVVALVVAAIVFGVTVMVSGGDPGLTRVEPDGRAVPLPSDRPLGEDDIIQTRFDTATRGYRMSQVDQALQRAAYDIGYKSELIGVLEAEVQALREGRIADADVLRRAREAAVAPPAEPGPAQQGAAAPEGRVAPDAASAEADTVDAGTAAAAATGGAEPTDDAPTHGDHLVEDPQVVVAGLPPEAVLPHPTPPHGTGSEAPVERR